MRPLAFALALLSVLAVVPSAPSDSGDTLLLFPTDLTLSPGNVTSGGLRDVDSQGYGDLVVEESCWAWNAQTNRTECNTNRYRLDFWFEWNAEIPPITALEVTLVAWRTNDSENVRVKVYNFKTGSWLVTSIILTGSPKTYQVSASIPDNVSLTFGALRIGFVDAGNDNKRTAVHVDYFGIEVVEK